MKKQTYIRIISFLSVISVVLAATSVFYAFKANKMKILLAAERERSLAELSEAIDAIGVNLQKSLYTSEGKRLSEAGSELYRLSTVAKDSLSEITEENEETETIFRFLSQVGDYTSYLSEKDKLSQ
ncbi:MAG: germination protein YpeB, partial [Clostridia bacterium]|nr:germination protein YpeB [Clostridia bacterium]